MNVRVLVATADADEILFLRDAFVEIETARHWHGWVQIEVLHAPALDDAIALMTDEPLDAVLLDLDLCGERPAEAFRRVQEARPRTPVTLLIRPEKVHVAVQLMREGAQDFLIANLVDSAPLAHALRTAIERHRLLSSVRAASREDSLTGLLNRTAFFALADRDRQLAEKLGCRWMVVIAELGDSGPTLHAGADQRRDLLLIQTADCLRRLTGPTDLRARIGDLRFGLGIFDSRAERVEAVWSRIHAAVRDGDIAIGAAIFDPARPASLDFLIEQAEQNLAPKAMAMRT
jgi:PleD family two-component response regulator